MRTIIAGSRSLGMDDLVRALIACPFRLQISTILSGGAAGIDRAGEYYARFNKIPLELHRANWSRYGRAAGMLRNTSMALAADALIAVWDGQSKGTAHMISIAREKGLTVHVHGANS